MSVVLLAQTINELVDGWDERIEYMVSINQNIERRAQTIRHPALLDELRTFAHDGVLPSASLDSSGGSSNKPGSKPPCGLDAADLVMEIASYARNCRWAFTDYGPSKGPRRLIAEECRGLVSIAQTSATDEDIDDFLRAMRSFVRRAKILLGHEQPSMAIQGTVCGECGGTLRVAIDASTDVRCAGLPGQPGCGTRYPRHQWIDLYQGMVDDAEAAQA